MGLANLDLNPPPPKRRLAFAISLVLIGAGLDVPYELLTDYSSRLEEILSRIIIFILAYCLAIPLSKYLSSRISKLA